MSLSKRSSSARKSKPAVSAPAPARVVSQVFVDMPTPSSGNGTTTTSPGSSVASTSTTPTPLFSSSSGSTTTVSTTSLLLSSGPSVFSASASNVPSTANDIAPQVFGEIPKPRPSPRKYSSPLHYYQEQEDSVQSTLVPGGNSNLPKQHLDVMPQPYGFDNLSRQSIIRADGTEKRYYALPEDYPLEQAAPPTSPSAEEKVGFTAPQFVTTAGLAPNLCFNDNATAGSDLMLVNSLQLPLVVSATPNVCKKIPVYDILVEKDSACLNLISDKPDFWLALKRQDDEWACNCPIMKAPDSSPTRSSQLSIEHSMRKLRLLWDPGATDLPIRFTTHVGATDQQGIYVYKSAMVHILAGQLGARRAPILKCTTMRSGAFGLVWTTLNASALLVLVVPCSTGMYCSLPSFEIRVKLQWDPGVLIVLQSYPAIPPIVTFIMQRAAHLFACQCPCSLSYNYMLKTAYCMLICLGEISVSCMSDPVQGLYSLSLTTPWDPGVLVMHSRIIIRSTRNIRDAELWNLSSPSSCQLPQSFECKMEQLFS